MRWNEYMGSSFSRPSERSLSFVIMALLLLATFLVPSSFASQPSSGLNAPQIVGHNQPQSSSYTIIIASAAGGTGSYSYPSNSGSVPAGLNVTLQVPSGTVISLTATPDSQHIFQGWDYGGSISVTNVTSSSTSMTVNGNGEVTATFLSAPIPATINIVPSASSVIQNTRSSGVTITVSVLNQYGRAMQGVVVTLSPAYPGSLSTNSVVTNSTGEASSYLTVAGTVSSQIIINVTASTSNGVQGEGSVIFLPPPPTSVIMTFAFSGLGSDASGSIVLIDGTKYNQSQLPIQFAWSYNSQHTVALTRTITGSSGSDEYVWQTTSGCGLSSYSGTLTASSTCTVSIVYLPMYLVTFVVNPSSVGKIGWSGADIASGSTSTSTTAWCQAGTILSILASSSSSSYNFQSWLGTTNIGISSTLSLSTSAEVNGPGTITASFGATPALQTIPITFSVSGLGSSTSGAVLIVDGISYTASQLPKQFSWVVGSEHSYSWAGTVATSSSPYIWQSTSGCAQSLQSNEIVMGSSCTLSALYQSAGASGSLSITTSGLATSQSVGISITGPSGFGKLLTISGGQKQTLTGLAPGTYLVIGGVANSWEPNQGSMQVNVLAGQTASLTIPYSEMTITVKQIQLTEDASSLNASDHLGYNVTATVLGTNGLGMSGQIVQFTINLGTLSSIIAVTNSGGEATAHIQSTSSGTAIVQATTDGISSPPISVVITQPQKTCQILLSESGLPMQAGDPTLWPVSIDDTNTSEVVQTNGEVFFDTVSCGIHSYSVTSPWSSTSNSSSSNPELYVSSFSSPPPTGLVDLTNQSVVTLTFNYVQANATLIFQESGLGQGVPWSVGVSGTAQTQTTSGYLQFSVATGNVAFEVSPPDEFDGLSTIGLCSPIQNTELHVTGECIVTLDFLSNQYDLNFQAPGLPIGMSFVVQLNGGAIHSPSNQFQVDDGLYSFAVYVSGAPSTLQTEASTFQVTNPVASGTVLVDGADVTVQIQFYLQTFIWSSNGALQPENCVVTNSSQNCVMYAVASSNTVGAVDQTSFSTNVQLFNFGVNTLQKSYQGDLETIQQMVESLFYSLYMT